jgi:hypothetical protein
MNFQKSYTATLSAKGCFLMIKLCGFLEEFDPLRQFSWRAEGGGAMKKCLTPASFWPSANRLAWRKATR